ncbi:MAG: glycosyltransferase [Candidatus Saccharimonadaceae bacterium]
MNNPKLSIIMAEYRTDSSYLKRAIESILQQSFDDFELIIVDDGTTAENLRFIQGIKDQRLRTISNKKNMGLVVSLNKAVIRAKSSYVVRMDTDDIAQPDRLANLYNFITTHTEYSVVGSRVLEFCDDTEIGLLGISGEKTSMQIMRGDVPIHPSVIMNRQHILEAGGYPDYRRAEDLALWCELLLKGRRIYVIEDILLKYRVNPRDYSKRTLKHRKGELSARIHYYPKLGAGPIEYIRILKSVIAGTLPAGVVRKYRSTYILHKNGKLKGRSHE